jgi:hypothetical protein
MFEQEIPELYGLHIQRIGGKVKVLACTFGSFENNQ